MPVIHLSTYFNSIGSPIVPYMCIHIYVAATLCPVTCVGSERPSHTKVVKELLAENNRKGQGKVDQENFSATREHHQYFVMISLFVPFHSTVTILTQVFIDSAHGGR